MKIFLMILIALFASSGYAMECELCPNDPIEEVYSSSLNGEISDSPSSAKIANNSPYELIINPNDDLLKDPYTPENTSSIQPPSLAPTLNILRQDFFQESYPTHYVTQQQVIPTIFTSVERVETLQFKNNDLIQLDTAATYSPYEYREPKPCCCYSCCCFQAFFCCYRSEVSIENNVGLRLQPTTPLEFNTSRTSSTWYRFPCFFGSVDNN